MKIKRFQTGGEMPTESAPAPAPEEQAASQAGGGAEEQLAQMAVQIVQQLGPEAAAALAQMIMQVLEQAGPAQGEPVYAKKGGKQGLPGYRTPSSYVARKTMQLWRTVTKRELPPEDKYPIWNQKQFGAKRAVR